MNASETGYRGMTPYTQNVNFGICEEGKEKVLAICEVFRARYFQGKPNHSEQGCRSRGRNICILQVFNLQWFR